MTWLRSATFIRSLMLALGLGVIVAAPIAHSAVTGTLGLIVNLQDIRTVGGDSVTAPISKGFTRTITNGTGVNQVNLCWADVRQLTTGANEDIDVAGALTNAYGTAVFTKVKYISVEAAPANTTNITVSRGAANGLVIFAAASDALAPLKPGSFFAFSDLSAAGVTVTAGTGDLVNIANSAGATATYTIVVCGLS